MTELAIVPALGTFATPSFVAVPRRNTVVLLTLKECTTKVMVPAVPPSREPSASVTTASTGVPFCARTAFPRVRSSAKVSGSLSPISRFLELTWDVKATGTGVSRARMYLPDTSGTAFTKDFSGAGAGVDGKVYWATDIKLRE